MHMHTDRRIKKEIHVPFIRCLFTRSCSWCCKTLLSLDASLLPLAAIIIEEQEPIICTEWESGHTLRHTGNHRVLSPTHGSIKHIWFSTANDHPIQSFLLPAKKKISSLSHVCEAWKARNKIHLIAGWMIVRMDDRTMHQTHVKDRDWSVWQTFMSWSATYHRTYHLYFPSFLRRWFSDLFPRFLWKDSHTEILISRLIRYHTLRLFSPVSWFCLISNQANSWRQEWVSWSLNALDAWGER